ncbi:R3H-associated N-terminal domain-containing protein [Lasiosphaeria hispida]|uniref:R3H-associated N-terminal domain-containing protein n=1 Tax=Lasiosphaeria hispida TaxID=260671 RepID=A0AAJ0HHR5_9PEZI|nr:R3H-associated N-terminal domain-containing protein [Lasiosphaeria hispida]
MAIETAPITPPSEDGSTLPITTSSPTAYPHLHHQHSISNASTATVDIESWTVAALESLSIDPIARGTGNILSIPLDSDHGHSTATPAPQMKLRGIGGGGAGITPPRRPPSARDSMKRRDELRKGNEGSRQRRRWENDHLLHVPNVQPPLPADWQVHPTHPVLPTVPYQLAKYWDAGLRERVEERKTAFATQRRMRAFVATGGTNAAAGGGAPLSAVPAAAVPVPDVGRVPRDLRATAKRTPAVKSWLRVLEEPVRQFLVDRGLVAEKGAAAEVESSTDSEDDEVVFVGRNGTMLEGKAWKKARRVGGEKTAAEAGMVLDMLGDDETGAFKRWLTHSISDYYGLDSKSVTMGNPARRVIYVGTKQLNQRHKLTVLPILPPPLWEMF